MLRTSTTTTRLFLAARRVSSLAAPAGSYTTNRRCFSSSAAAFRLTDHNHYDDNNKNHLRRRRFSSSFEVIPKNDRGELEEYSVIHTNRSLNIMSKPFKTIMGDLRSLLLEAYNAHRVAIIPGSGTYGMEAAARQFASSPNSKVMVIRNGQFSYRWTQILEAGNMPSSGQHTVIKGRPVSSVSEEQPQPQYAPPPIEEVVEKIKEEKPSVLFCPHVETSTGIILTDDYIRTVSKALREANKDSILVLDCVASGTVWVDTTDLGVDVLISAPQKGWSGPCCAAMVTLSERAYSKMIHDTEETSFSMSLKRWTNIMDVYNDGGYQYHTTMPTDSLRDFHEVAIESLQRFGSFEKMKQAQIELGTRLRTELDTRGYVSVSAPGCQAPGVLVYHSPSRDLNMMTDFKEKAGMQIAAGVPWMLDEPEQTSKNTFRIGLFGIDKLADIDGTIKTFTSALDSIVVVNNNDTTADAASASSRNVVDTSTTTIPVSSTEKPKKIAC